MKARSSWCSSFVAALRGLAVFVRTERNARIELAFAVIVIPLGIALKLPLAEVSILLLTIGLVLALEAVNSAFERVVDLVHPQQGEPARVIKDMAAGAVLIAAITSVAVGAILLGPPLWDRMMR